MSTWSVCEVVEQASSHALLEVEEAKQMLGIIGSDPAQDELLKLLIDIASGQISAYCADRVFARETVIERFYDEDIVTRLFLSRFPVKYQDIQGVTNGNGQLFDDYDLDERAGKLITGGGWVSPVVVTYTGGYELPSQSPPALKGACALLLKGLWTAASTGGGAGGPIRMVAHKESRVMYYNTTGGDSGSGASKSIGTAGTDRAVQNLLAHFTRFWV